MRYIVSTTLIPNPYPNHHSDPTSKWSSSTHVQEHLDFMLQLHSYKCLELFQYLKPLLFGFHHVNPHIPRKLLMKNNKIFYPSHICVFHGAANTQIHDLS